jgi:sulfur carrier protein
LKIKLNGETIDTTASTLSELCNTLGYDLKAKIATAVNGEFVSADKRGDLQLSDNDEIEIVAPRQGG